MSGPQLSKEQILERERRWGVPVGIASVGAVVLSIGAGVVVRAAGLIDDDTKATELASQHAHSTALLGVALLTAIGGLLLIAPFLYLFRATQARVPAIRGPLVAFAFLGPVFLAVQALLSWAANTSVANDYVDQVGGRTGDAAANFAQDLIDNSSFLQSAGAFAIPALVGMVIAMFFVSMQAMRAGLLTRFWGTFGMAFGIGILLLGLFGVMCWALYVGFLAAGWLGVVRPPAWAAGEAIPWPTPDRQRVRPPPDDAVEGSGREIDVGSDDPTKEPKTIAPAPGGRAGEAEQPPVDAEEMPVDVTETQGQRRKKRKRRG